MYQIQIISSDEKRRERQVKELLRDEFGMADIDYLVD